jgi:tetratricopeptide (TPR) repeat protein
MPWPKFWWVLPACAENWFADKKLMPKISNNKTKNLLILSSIRDRLGVTAKRLSLLARQAYVNRDYELLRAYYEILLNLGSVSEDAGLLYKGLYESISNPLECGIFERLAESSDPRIRAASILKLGGIAYRKNHEAEAQKLILLANKIALSNNMCAPLIAFNAQDAYSGILSAQGAHDESLRILQNNSTLVNYLGGFFPVTKGEFLNNCAYEHLQMGNFEAAWHLINKAIALPTSYPEWLETREEIEQKLKIRKSSIVTVPTSYTRQKIKNNVVFFPAPSSCFHLTLNFHGNVHTILRYYLYDCEESETRFIALIDVLDSFCVNNKTRIKLDGYLNPDHDEVLRYQGYVSENDLDDLHIFISNVRSYESKSPMMKIYHRERTDDKDARETTAWLLSMLNENMA